MTDLNIRRGLSTELFVNGKLNPNIVLEEGCWYLCTDTAELFLGILKEGQLTLKQINESNSESIDPAILAALREEIDAIKESLSSYATEKYVIDAIETHEGIAKKEEVLEVKTKLEDEVIPTIQETIIPTVQELAEKAATQAWVQEQNFATENFVTEKFSEIELPEVPTKVSELENDAEYITAKDIPETDLTGYATEEFVADEIAKIDIPDVSDFITMSDVEAKKYLTEHQDISHLAEKEHTHTNYAAVEHEHEQYLTEHQDLSEYAKKSEIPSTAGLATEKYVDNAISNIEISETEIYKVDFNAPDYIKAVEAYNTGKVLVLINAAPDANSYAVMNYVSEKYITFTKFLTSRSEAYGSFNTYYLSPANTWEVSKEVKLNRVEANAEGEGSSELTSIRIGKEIYAIPNTKGLASEEFVTEAISALEIPEVPTNISEFINDAGYLTQHQDISHLATKEEIPDVSDFIKEVPAEYITEEELNARGYVSDISGKADIDHDHDDLYDAKGAAQAVRDELLNGAGEAYDTLKELGNLIDNNKEALEALETIAAGKADKEHTHSEYLTERALDSYAKKTEIPDVTGFIKEIPAEYVTEAELEAKGFITEHQDLSDYAKKSDIPTDYLTAVPDEYITESELANELAKIEHPTIDLSGYATEAWVNEQRFLTEHQDLSDYAKLTDIPTDYLKEVPSEYVTETELADKGYLTEHQSLEAYAKKEELFSKSYNDLTDKPEIPSIEGLATEEYVRTEINKIDIPEVDLTGLVTSDQLGVALAEKANNVPFTSAKFITKPFGDFTYGENIINLSVAEILAKLLGLTDKDPNSTEPDEPSEPESIVENIIKNKLPMYAITKNATLEQVPYKLLTLTEDAAAKTATESGFYQIVDADGKVIESGYQELQIASDEVYYVIALPKAINYDTMVSVKAWNDLENCWTDTGARKPALTCDENTVAALCGEFDLDISHIDTTVYTVWAMEGTPDGSKYRFVINE